MSPINSRKLNVKKIKGLLYKEFLLELRHKSGFSGVLIYSLSSIYICYLAFLNVLEPHVWNALFWIIILFSATNAIAKSFISESRSLQLFYYSLLSPKSVIIAKTIYNVLFLFVLTVINYLVYCILLGNVVQDLPFFALVLFFGTASLATVLTLVSALASRAGNSAALMAILGFPILVPLLITVIRLTNYAIQGASLDLSLPYLIILIAIDVLTMALSYLLFPYLWRE